MFNIMSGIHKKDKELDGNSNIERLAAPLYYIYRDEEETFLSLQYLLCDLDLRQFHFDSDQKISKINALVLEQLFADLIPDSFAHFVRFFFF